MLDLVFHQGVRAHSRAAMVAAPAGARIDADFSLQTGGGMALSARREGAIWPGYRNSYQLHPGHLQHRCSARDWIDQILLLPIDQVEGRDVIPPNTIVRIIHRLLLPVDFHIALVVGTVFGVVDMRIVEAVQLFRRHSHVALPDRLEFDVGPAATDDDPQVPVGDQRPGTGEKPHRQVPVDGNPQTGLVILRHGLLLNGTAGISALRIRAFQLLARCHWPATGHRSGSAYSSSPYAIWGLLRVPSPSISMYNDMHFPFRK